MILYFKFKNLKNQKSSKLKQIGGDASSAVELYTSGVVQCVGSQALYWQPIIIIVVYNLTVYYRQLQICRCPVGGYNNNNIENYIIIICDLLYDARTAEERITRSLYNIILYRIITIPYTTVHNIILRVSRYTILHILYIYIYIRST